MSAAREKHVKNALREILEKHAEISFVYVYGSFAENVSFRDIDVAVYLRDIPVSPLDYELSMETELMGAVGIYPIDVRILNVAPMSFRYNVIKQGIILFVKNDDERADFQEDTLSKYFDFAPYRSAYLKETLSLGV